MSQLVTLSKNSPEFESYLTGEFSDTKRAIPIQTLNVNSASEIVTFKVVPIKDIQMPSLYILLLQTYKVRSFLLVLVPLLLLLTKNIEDKTLRDPISALLATFGILFAFISINLRNDYMDHMKGIDRVFQKSGSRAIQNGWVAAHKLRKYSIVFLSLSLFFALPIVLAYPAVGFIALLGFIVGYWAQFQKENSFKYQVGGEFAIFLMLGPLLTVGYQLSMGASFDKESLSLGLVWGWLVLFVIHLRNFADIFSSGQAGFKNTITWLGFDKARRMLAIWWAIFLFFNFSYHEKFAGSYWGFYLNTALVFMSLGFIRRLKNVSSSVGSDLREVFRAGFNLFLLTIGLWLFECLWYLVD